MPNPSKDLNVLAYANGFTVWHYDAATMPDGPSIDHAFDQSATMLRPGDMILISGTTASGAYARLAVVSAIDGGRVRLGGLTP